jgi:hypothetical protein
MKRRKWECVWERDSSYEVFQGNETWEWDSVLSRLCCRRRSSTAFCQSRQFQKAISRKFLCSARWNPRLFLHTRFKIDSLFFHLLHIFDANNEENEQKFGDELTFFFLVWHSSSMLSIHWMRLRRKSMENTSQLNLNKFISVSLFSTLYRETSVDFWKKRVRDCWDQVHHTSSRK